MEKKKYYINLSGESGDIFDDKQSATYQYEIEATPEELGQLQSLMLKQYHYDHGNFYRSHVPFLQYHDDESNDNVDNSLADVYAKIQELGTPETKQFLESNGIVNKIRNNRESLDPESENQEFT